MTDTERSFEELEESVAPIKQQLIGIFREVYEGHQFPAHPRGQHQKSVVKRFLANPESLIIGTLEVVLVHKKPTIWFLIPKEKPEGEDVNNHIEIPKQLKDRILAEIADGDFAILAEYGARRGLKYAEEALENCPSEKLDTDFNGVYTWRQSYEMKIREAQRTLQKVMEGAANPKETVDVEWYQELPAVA